MFSRILAIVLSAALLTASTSPQPIAAQFPTATILPSETPVPADMSGCIGAWWNEAEPLVEQFLDTAEVANYTSRITLSSVILQMRQTQREFEHIPHPDCTEMIFGELSYGMDVTVQGFNYFMGEFDASSALSLVAASQSFWNAYDELRRAGLSADIRLSDTSRIWGGASPNGVTATARANSVASLEANMTALQVAQEQTLTATAQYTLSPSPTATLTIPPSLTPTPTATLPPTPTLTPLPTIAGIPQEIPSNPQPDAIALLATNGNVNGSGFTLPFDMTTFARNPLDPSRMAVVDLRGLLYMFFGGLTAQDGALVRVSPFSDFEPSSADTNQARVRQIGWSPDGNYLAFLVDAEADDRDGVWYIDNPQHNSISKGYQVFRECPLVMTRCIVDFGGGPFVYNSFHFEWNNFSNALLIELYLPQEDRRAFTVVGLNADPTHLPPIYRYDYASWSWNGTRVLASGGGEDGLVGLRWIDPATGSIQLILNSGAHGLWLQDAVEQPNGQIVALGSSNDANSPMRLYDLTGAAVSDPIGSAAPERVAWSPDRSAVLVVINVGLTRRYYIAKVNGMVQEITASVVGAPAVEWIGGGLPAIGTPGAPVPTAITSAYGLSVNKLVQVIAPVGLNLRVNPSSTSQELALMKRYEYVVIVGGPVEEEGLIWWQVQMATGQVGWAIEGVNGIQLLSLKPL